MALKEPKLNIYNNKKVKVIAIDGKIYVGKVDLYTPAHDNDGEEAISLDIGMWFDETDIKSIQVTE